MLPHRGKVSDLPNFPWLPAAAIYMKYLTLPLRGHDHLQMLLPLLLCSTPLPAHSHSYLFICSRVWDWPWCPFLPPSIPVNGYLPWACHEGCRWVREGPLSSHCAYFLGWVALLAQLLSVRGFGGDMCGAWPCLCAQMATPQRRKPDALFCHYLPHSLETISLTETLNQLSWQPASPCDLAVSSSHYNS